MSSSRILVVNSGSSSLKLGFFSQILRKDFDESGEEEMIASGEADGIGSAGGTLSLYDAAGKVLRQAELPMATQHQAFEQFQRWFEEIEELRPAAVGHRVVHGGPKLVTHQLITDEVMKTLRASVSFAPLHIPSALTLIAESQRAYPDLPQFAYFDTVFHRTLPDVAAKFALPEELFVEGVRRYGFHGLSYESILHQVGGEVPGRTVIAHLGSGASLAAIKDGHSVDTSMGLTPASGIPMASRCGDIDPSVIVFLMRGNATADSLEELLNRGSGLKALGGESDMRKLEANARQGDRRAAEAIEIFCRSIAKMVAGYASVLDGLDLLVFTGGIGEHSAQVRADVCGRLGFMELVLGAAANEKNSAVITTADSSVQVKVMATGEDEQIARHVREMMSGAA